MNNICNDVRNSDALVFIRRHQGMDYSVKNFAKSYLDCVSFRTISEYNNADIYINLNKNIAISEESYPIACNILENSLQIIARDRVLRNISYEEACFLLRKATYFFIDLFENYTPSFLVIYPVDNYVMDILVRVARIKEIKVYGVCNFFVSKWKRITVYGEHNTIREVDDKEIKEFVAQIQGNFRSHMVRSRVKTTMLAIKDYLKYKLRWVIFYCWFYKISGRLNYDYISTIRISAVRSILNFFCLNIFKNELPEKAEKVILIPLHYYPEATLEYWSSNMNDVDFPNSLRIQLYKLINKGYKIYLKEHPAMVFRNSLSFYQSISKEFEGKVQWLDPFTSNSSLFKNFETVFAWTGSSGLEALVNGKKVIFGSNNYYLEANDISEREIQLTESQINPFVKNILSGTIRVEYE